MSCNSLSSYRFTSRNSYGGIVISPSQFYGINFYGHHISESPTSYRISSVPKLDIFYNSFISSTAHISLLSKLKMLSSWYS